MKQVNKSVNAENRAAAIREMFSAIAPRYDFLNRLLSLGIDQSWRRTLVRMALTSRRGPFLDVACGTGDVALALRAKAPRVEIVGVDFSPEMLELARKKSAAAGAGLQLRGAAAEALPFADNYFELLTIAFGIRNVVDREQALAEFYRVLKPGGRLAVLEFSQLEPGILEKLYNFYFFQVLPLVGGLFSRAGAYRYLPESVAAFPSRPEFAGLIRDAGFVNCRYHELTFGVAALYLAEKVESASIT
ncbi:MAG: bifunctional demethylmenaquinone methyltransferase/2-methoxy-6-polyprenyl-1,4-benzoquinol methylase UbiE [Deltaproteobacteria bacterium]|nr:bifunctional demethylmenaquinone methyltransferase/2-methoxy-6-polyprenyl-1,4-benzoquinol methylase UbiE [Deltaproteobacteria bacterium]